ncbi:hypothetical protein [Amycolatopsis arida]|uniref:hypothetical protein n=1 Tax=Amycolatopsis arida TaxID=587909 RepID=UPI001066F6A0|nr:hypothetical protein [Amycolatopsis arida]TDX84930.1 hypothetical protein CLV69_11714 [Amycolatopsis arida]
MANVDAGGLWDEFAVAWDRVFALEDELPFDVEAWTSAQRQRATAEAALDRAGYAQPVRDAMLHLLHPPEFSWTPFTTAYQWRCCAQSLAAGAEVVWSTRLRAADALAGLAGRIRGLLPGWLAAGRVDRAEHGVLAVELHAHVPVVRAWLS